MKSTKFEKAVISLIAVLATILIVLIASRASVRPTVTAYAHGHGPIAHSARYTAYSGRYTFPDSDVTVIRFGDCMADNADGDIYSTPNPWCETVPSEQGNKVTKKDGEQESTVPTVIVIDDGGVWFPSDPSDPETPAVTPDDKGTDDMPAKEHCNNGNGNGPEGCNASQHGNEDETANKGDKVDGRSTGNSEQGNENSEHGNDGSHGNGGNGH